MAVNVGSRYEYATVDYLPVGYRDVKKPVLFYWFDNIGSISYVEYTWKDGDRLDRLANEYYGNSSMWWIIAEHNPEISDHQNIEPGKVLRIPRA